MGRVKAEIRPEPDDREREALLAAVRDETAVDASPYRSAWREATDEEADFGVVTRAVEPGIAGARTARARAS
jgi:hypothetical protein